MGLSASQGRMLLLTARKSDLEFRAQQISQKRLVLSQQLEDIASDYEDATSDRQMKITLYSTSSDSEDAAQKITKEVNLTYSNLVSGSLGTTDGSIQPNLITGEQAYTSNVAYRLVNFDGAIVVSNVNEIPGVSFDDNGELNTTDSAYEVKKGADGKLRVSMESTGAVYVVDTNLATGSTDTTGSITGPNYLQDCLRNGKYLIQRFDSSSDEGKWRNISWDATANISDGYYQDNDDSAKAKYDRLQQQIQSQDKKLEMELDNVETQRSAVKTEEESVKKVIDENIEKSFNAFG